MMLRFFLALTVAGLAIQGAALSKPANGAVNVTLWDVPNGNQIRGTATFQPTGNGFNVRIGLRVASYGPDAALIGSGTCTSYKKVLTLKPAIKGLSVTTLKGVAMAPLFSSPHVVVFPRLEYCGALKTK